MDYTSVPPSPLSLVSLIHRKDIIKTCRVVKPRVYRGFFPSFSKQEKPHQNDVSYLKNYLLTFLIKITVSPGYQRMGSHYTLRSSANSCVLPTGTYPYARYKNTPLVAKTLIIQQYALKR